MRIYYRGPDALITATQFIWQTDVRQAWAIADLRLAHITRGYIKGAWRPAAIVVAFVTMAIVLPLYGMLTSVAARSSLLAVAPLIVILAMFRARVRPHWELVASYPDRRVTLYEAANATTFHQVTRALGRVLESGEVTIGRSRSVVVAR